MTQAKTSAVVCRNVGRAFGTNGTSRQILTNIDLDIEPGEIISIIGASGSGKSTLLRALGGLDIGFTGQVLIHNTAVEQYDPRCAIGFQEPRLLPWATVTRQCGHRLTGRHRQIHRQRTCCQLLTCGTIGCCRSPTA